jgi:glycosyltransferase involved in cell wall biosynthesis
MKNILPVLQALHMVPEPLCYHIYGPVKSRAYWQQCQAVIASLPSHIRVAYHGDLHPSRLEEVLQGCHVFILPSKSENFGHALYEALSAARPAITSHGTPWNGLEAATAGKNINPENGQELTDAIRFFGAMTRESLEYWNQGARRYAEGALNREEIKQQYRCMFGVYKPALPVT